jgi:hypothetical protein
MSLVKAFNPVFILHRCKRHPDMRLRERLASTNKTRGPTSNVICQGDIAGLYLPLSGQVGSRNDYPYRMRSSDRFAKIGAKNSFEGVHDITSGRKVGGADQNTRLAVFELPCKVFSACAVQYSGLQPFELFVALMRFDIARALRVVQSSVTNATLNWRIAIAHVEQIGAGSECMAPSAIKDKRHVNPLACAVVNKKLIKCLRHSDNLHFYCGLFVALHERPQARTGKRSKRPRYGHQDRRAQ